MLRLCSYPSTASRSCVASKAVLQLLPAAAPSLQLPIDCLKQLLYLCSYSLDVCLYEVPAVLGSCCARVIAWPHAVVFGWVTNKGRAIHRGPVSVVQLLINTRKLGQIDCFRRQIHRYRGLIS